MHFLHAALAGLALLASGCAALAAPAGWAHAAPGRSLAADSADCHAEARETTLAHRGPPDTLMEHQQHRVSSRLHFGSCMAARGWQRSSARAAD